MKFGAWLLSATKGSSLGVEWEPRNMVFSRFSTVRLRHMAKEKARGRKKLIGKTMLKEHSENRENQIGCSSAHETSGEREEPKNGSFGEGRMLLRWRSGSGGTSLCFWCLDIQHKETKLHECTRTPKSCVSSTKERSSDELHAEEGPCPTLI